MLLAGAAMGAGVGLGALRHRRPMPLGRAIRGAELAGHALLCKTMRDGALRSCTRTSNMKEFSLGLVPAQAFRASRSEAAPLRIR